jgi:hypothetical protein
MSYGIGRKHGHAFAAGFYGYQPALVTITSTNRITADSSSGGFIVDGGYTKVMRALEQFASIVVLGDQDGGNDNFSAIVDLASFNQGDGMGGQGGSTSDLSALKAAVDAAIGGTCSVTVATTLQADGSWA